jgi:hypothetical protein
MKITDSEARKTAKNTFEPYTHGPEIGADVNITTCVILRSHNSNWHHCPTDNTKVNHCKVKWSSTILVQCGHIEYCTEPHFEMWSVQDMDAILKMACLRPTLFHKKGSFVRNHQVHVKAYIRRCISFLLTLAKLEGTSWNLVWMWCHFMTSHLCT